MHFRILYANKWTECAWRGKNVLGGDIYLRVHRVACLNSFKIAGLKLTCFLRNLQICCSTMVISRSTRSMFWISSSLERRVGTRSRSASMGTGLTGEMGSIFPMELLLLCSCIKTSLYSFRPCRCFMVFVKAVGLNDFSSD